MKTVGQVPSASISISPYSSGGTTVRIRSGHADDKTEVDASIVQSRTRIRRQKKERRGKRWLRGKLAIHFGFVAGNIHKSPRSGEIKLGVAHSNISSRARRKDRQKGRMRSERLMRSLRTIRGIPFNYYYTLNRLYSRLCLQKSCPFSDFHLRSLVLQDNGNVIPLSVTALSVALADVGYGQKDFLVAAKAIINGDDISVEPTKAQEESIDLARIHSGQGIVVLQYLAFTNKIAHVFSKGQFSLDQHKKAIAACLAVCQSNALVAVEALRRKYDNSLDEKRSHSTSAIAAPVKAALSLTDTQKSGMKASFGQMLTGINTSMTINADSGAAIRPSPVPQSQNIAPPSQPGAKKLTLAELAKRKKQ